MIALPHESGRTGQLIGRSQAAKSESGGDAFGNISPGIGLEEFKLSKVGEDASRATASKFGWVDTQFSQLGKSAIAFILRLVAFILRLVAFGKDLARIFERFTLWREHR